VGPAGAGKDTLAAWIADDFGAVRLGLADPLREFAQTLLGPGKHRATLQALGDALRAAQPLVLVAAAQRRVAGLPRWVITDARRPEEVTAFPDALPIAVTAPRPVRVARLRQRDNEPSPPLGHSSEAVEAAQRLCRYHLANAGSWDAFWRAYVQTIRPAVYQHWSVAPGPCPGKEASLCR